MKKPIPHTIPTHPLLDILCGWGIRWGMQVVFALGFGIGVGIISVWLGTWFAAR